MAEFVAVILAGGKARRLDNKPFLKINGQLMIERIYGSFCKIFQDVFFCVKQEQASKLADVLPKAKFIIDNYDGHAALYGMKSAVDQLHFDNFFFSACDTPFLEPRLIAKINEGLEGHDACMPLNQSGRMEPLLAAYRKGPLLAFCNKAIGMNDLRLRNIGDMLNVNYLDYCDILRIDPKGDSFININTANDWIKYSNQ